MRLRALAPLLVLCACAAPVAAAGNWSFSGDWRLRGEQLRDSFRLLAPASDTLWLSRLQASLDYRGPQWQAGMEVQDSRAWSAERLTPLGTDDVNALEPLQLWLGRRWRLRGGTLDARAGRMSLDFGSRRLLARNNFRNTSNALEGALLRWEGPGSRAQLLYSRPLQRRPGALQRERLRDNDFRLDRGNGDERLWLASSGVAKGWGRRELDLEVYAMGARRRGFPGGAAPGRDLSTAGARLLWRTPALRLELDGAWQWGESQAQTTRGLAWQAHRAAFAHAGIEWYPGGGPEGLSLQGFWDYASGDSDPGDGRQERFDRLYGARAFDLGPSGIFGVAIRSNLRSSGLRLRWQSRALEARLSYRRLRLDSARDALVSSARRDLSGASGRDVGDLLDARLRWPLPVARPALRLELGAAWLRKGRFFRGSAAAGAGNPPQPAPADSSYLYTQLLWSF